MSIFDSTGNQSGVHVAPTATELEQTVPVTFLSAYQNGPIADADAHSKRHF